MKKQYFILFVCLFIGQNLTAGKIKKGFRSLEVYNYFDAKRLFEKALKKDEVAASYGLSLIYIRKDNPFYNIDSAYNFIQRSTTKYSQLSPNKKLKYASYGADSLRIFEQREEVSNELFEQAKLNHTVLGYQFFMDNNSWSKHIDSTIYLRDKLAFYYAINTKKAVAFKEFLTNYPQSEFANEAQSAYDRLNYQEYTKDNQFINYIAFIKDFPNSPYRSDAEDQVYSIYTKTGSLESYKNFIADYSKNRNIPIAWKKMFTTYLQNDYSTNSIQAFMKEFDNYPFRDELLKQLNMVEQILYPIKIRNKWGFIDETGSIYITPKYEGAEEFHEGLAIVQLDGKYGFVDKTGEILIDAIFEDAYQMNEGHAVVQIGEEWGLINRSGEFVIQPEYEDLGNLNEGLSYFSNGELYGYYDQKGIIRLKQQYTSAEDFNNGSAIVSKNNNYGLIDVFGTTIIPFKYEKMKSNGENFYIAKFDGKWGAITAKGDSIVGFYYNFIGKMNNNRAIIEKEGLFNYIDSNGRIILEDWIETYPEYRQLAIYMNDYAKIEYDNGYNLINSNGKKLFTRDKQDIGKFGKLIAVKKGDKWGYVNKAGRLVINYQYTSAESFSTNLTKAGGAPLVGIINKSGTYLIEPFFEKLNFFNDTVLIAKSRGQYGLLLTKGDTLLHFNYLSIEPYAKDVVLLETKEAVFYYHLKQQKFIRKEE